MNANIPRGHADCQMNIVELPGCAGHRKPGRVRTCLLLAGALVVGALGNISDARSFPVATAGIAGPDLLVLARHGCGKGWHRDPFGQCVRDNSVGFGWNSRTGWGPVAPTCPNGKVRKGSRWVCR
jgi:hypothetical protein